MRDRERVRVREGVPQTISNSLTLTIWTLPKKGPHQSNTLQGLPQPHLVSHDTPKILFDLLSYRETEIFRREREREGIENSGFHLFTAPLVVCLQTRRFIMRNMCTYNISVMHTGTGSLTSDAVPHELDSFSLVRSQDSYQVWIHHHMHLLLAPTPHTHTKVLCK